ncbi:MAG: pentapeptide repeat-containing protein [Paracoccaceae bacterium]
MAGNLKDRNKNPWYVLATVFGEQPEGAGWLGYDQGLAVKNRRAWNGWFCADLTPEERKDRAEKTGLPKAELRPLTDGERAKVLRHFRERMGADVELPDRSQDIDFSETDFARPVIFEQFVFEETTHFHSATFSGYTLFRSATFSGAAGFGSATFSGTADFRSATFSGYALFSSAKFKLTTSFKDARFLTAVPQFHATELYDDTVFTLPENYRDNWPPIFGQEELKGVDKPRVVMPAVDQKRAYNRLRLFMNKTLQTDEEQFFHRQEMRCKKQTDGWAYWLIYTIFEGLSDYGNSVWWPAMFLFVLWTLGVAVLASFDMNQKLYHAAGWSFANLFPFFGFRRFYDTSDYHGWLALIAGVQTVFGFILLFFHALGQPNRFRLR